MPDPSVPTASVPDSSVPMGVPLAVRATPPATLPPLPSALTWRALTVDDAVALHTLVGAIEVADNFPYRMSEPEIDEWLREPWRDLATDSVAGFDRSGVLRAYGLTDTKPGDSTIIRAFVDGGVHPDLRGQGIGSAVLAWLVGRARQLLAASGKQGPARIVTYTEDAQPPTANAVIERGGFTALRFYSTLMRPLADLRAPALSGAFAAPAGIRILPWSAEWDEQVRGAHNEAFADHWGSQPLTAEDWAHGKSMFAPSWSFLAVSDDGPQPVVAGYLLSGKYEQDWPVAGHSFGFVEKLGVRREFRGRKIATSLMTTAMRAYAADGMHSAHLGVDTKNPSGADGLYTMLGFVKLTGSRMYSIEI